VIIAVAAFLVVFPAPAFLMLDTGNPALVVLVIVIGFVFAAYGTVGSQGAAAFAELAGSRYRYAGVTLGREFSAVLGGGIAPLLGRAGAAHRRLDRRGGLHERDHARQPDHGDPDAGDAWSRPAPGSRRVTRRRC
jgi:hypothetical protein